MQYNWYPRISCGTPGNDAWFECADGSQWKVGILPTGCVVLWGHDALGRWTATCAEHGVLELGGPAPDAHTSYHAAMAHKPEPESPMAQRARRRVLARLS